MEVHEDACKGDHDQDMPWAPNRDLPGYIVTAIPAGSQVCDRGLVIVVIVLHMPCQQLVFPVFLDDRKLFPYFGLRWASRSTIKRVDNCESMHTSNQHTWYYT